MSVNTITISTEMLEQGMTVVSFDDYNKMKIEAALKEQIPGTRGCRGKHFKTFKKETVCYLPGGKVIILV